MKEKLNKKYFFLIIIIALLIFWIANVKQEKNVITTSSLTVENLSSKKIEWGIKRNENHEQPDLGSVNKRIIDEQNGIAMGNKDSKKVYLTFDEGYEAGYTSKILDTLKDNNVKAAFFITGHYLNTQSDLVKRMIDEGHIVRKPITT